MGPAATLESEPNPDMKKKNIPLGSHYHAWIGTTNTMKKRTVPEILLNESNEHSSHYFMRIFTRKKLHFFEWEEFSTDNDLSSCEETLAKN